MTDQSSLDSERKIHGRNWSSVHNGYFADPVIAQPFLDAITHEFSNLRPDVVADLGGGTGFILSELAKRHPGDSVKYINVDISAEQLAHCKYEDILTLEIPITDITRRVLTNADDRLLIIMRSLLHYLGAQGFWPFLKHLRAQMKPGETMVHQTACFDYSEDADCANHLYSLMRTLKWYPTVGALEHALIETGWEVIGSEPAPSLHLRCEELAERYNLTEEDIAQIGIEIGRKHDRPRVFVLEGSRFTAFLHYRIFTCLARE